MTQMNNTPMTIDARNAYFQNLVSSSTDHAGYNGYPCVIDRIVEKGAENIYYIGRNYRGLYHDDYCTFTYYDNTTGEVFYDEWTTAFAAPHFDLYEDNILTFKEAVELGLVDMNKVKEHNMQIWLNQIETMKLNDLYYVKKYMNEFTGFYPMIKVERGRKWKGTGFLLEISESVYSWGPSYGRGYNSSTSWTARILSMEDWQIHYCNAEYLQFVNAEAIMDEYREYAKSQIIGKIFTRPQDHFVMDNLIWKLHNDDYNRQFADMFQHFITYGNGDVAKSFKTVGYLAETAFDEKIYEELKKKAERRAEQFNGIMNWVKESTDKDTPEGQLELALRVLLKK